MTEVQGEVEIRRYAPQIPAETTVDSEFDSAGNLAFRRLFDSMSGSYRGRLKIAMTAPVNQEASPQKIPMTSPVVQEGADTR